MDLDNGPDISGVYGGECGFAALMMGWEVDETGSEGAGVVFFVVFEGLE